MKTKVTQKKQTQEKPWYRKKRFIHCVCIVLCALLMMLLPLGTDSIFGSTTDWIGQHTTFADYFRTLFYDTHDLFPDYAFHIGSGSNIYYFSYYGLLNPLLMISYLLPHVSMATYMMGLNIILVCVTGVLLYLFLTHKKFTENLSLLTTLIFLFSTFLIFHAHRHYMFINYMPFLLLGLFGVDRYFETKKKGLFIFSVFMMILSSYYYSVTGIVVLALYTIAMIVQKEDTYSFKTILKQGYPLLLCTFLSILMSLVLLLPTASVILSGRGSEESGISLLSLLLPRANLTGLLYDPYTLGVTACTVVAIFSQVFSKKKGQRFLSICFLLILCFPICIYILNGTLYVREKILFPFFPILALFFASFLTEVKENRLSWKGIVATIIFYLLFLLTHFSYWFYLFDLLYVLILLYFTKKKKCVSILGIGTLVLSVILCFITQLEESYPSREKYQNEIQSSVKQELITSALEKETEFVRMGDRNDVLYTVNQVYHPYAYRYSMYSSTYHKGYVDFLRNDLKIAYASRNPMILKENDDLLASYFLGVKYIVAQEKELGYGYEQIAHAKDEKSGRTYYLFENKNVLPVLYGRSQAISEETYQQLNYPENVLALLQYTVVEDGNEDVVIEGVEPLDGLEIEEEKNVTVEKEEEEVVITAKEDASFYITLPDDIEDDLIIFEMDIKEQASCENGDLSMVIEGVENKLTCKEWQYQNHNDTFHYVISHHEQENRLEVTLKPGTYHFQNIHTYRIQPEFLEQVNDDISQFQLDRDKTKGDLLTGSITMKEDGYFVTSIPYDTGFSVTVDGKQVEYEQVNHTFLGFPLEEGDYEIEITYEAPYKKIGMIGSGIGFIIWMIILYLDRKK